MEIKFRGGGALEKSNSGGGGAQKNFADFPPYFSNGIALIFGWYERSRGCSVFMSGPELRKWPFTSGRGFWKF